MSHKDFAMRRLMFGLLAAGCLAGCQSQPDMLVVTTTSPAKCFYDSNVNQTRCRHDVAMTGEAAADPRSPRHDIDLMRQPLGFMDVLADGVRQSQRPTAYRFGYDSRFEAGYRTPERFDTTVYEGTDIAVPVPPGPAPRPARRPVYKD